MGGGMTEYLVYALAVLMIGRETILDAGIHSRKKFDKAIGQAYSVCHYGSLVLVMALVMVHWL